MNWKKLHDGILEASKIDEVSAKILRFHYSSQPLRATNVFDSIRRRGPSFVPHVTIFILRTYDVALIVSGKEVTISANYKLDDCINSTDFIFSTVKFSITEEVSV